jgi:hypothetical protein
MTECLFIRGEYNCISCPDVGFYRAASSVPGVAQDHFRDSCKGGQHCERRIKLEAELKKAKMGEIIRV